LFIQEQDRPAKPENLQRAVALRGDKTLSDENRKPSILCISTYEKGQPFLCEAAAQGCEVSLLTVDKLTQADWPRDALTHFFTMNEGRNPQEILATVLGLARHHRIDRVVALDEFDLEAAALIREHMRLPGMSQTATYLFRDKLAMRSAARAAGILVPDFHGVFFHHDLYHFMRNTEGPWLLKPRTSASAIGIRRIERPDQLWPVLDELGDRQSNYILERFLPGAVFHCEGVTWQGELLFAQPFIYGQPPIDTMHKGGIFSTRALPPDSQDSRDIVPTHAALLKALNMTNGVTHSEFIRASADGQIYFLETAARVGGAYIADVVQHARNLNPWVEWARIESALAHNTHYTLPPLTHAFAGSVICLARQQNPDTSAFTDPEVVCRLHKDHHAGLILRSQSPTRIEELIAAYTQRFIDQFLAVQPAPDKPTA
jgi:hypothetical protein